LARYNADGSLDTTFGSGGMLTTDIGGTADVASSVTIQSDDKILVAGNNGTDFALARYDTYGNLDATFGSGGIFTIDAGDRSSGDYAVYVTEQTDGKIVVVGQGSTGSGPGPGFAIVRLEDNGTADATFGTNGVLVNYIGEYGTPYGATVQTDGKILVTGRDNRFFGRTTTELGLARFNSDGTVDAIGDILSNDVGTDVTVQADGKILVTGNDFLRRYNQNLSLDTTFSGDGYLATDFGGSSE
ncbi:MAG: hypothetical protein GY770_35170, partial [Aestuariibacter sp.]|nr:hypothetical protein [Aestuariibacter sp.]